MYVTKKQVANFIKHNMLRHQTTDDLKSNVENVLTNLNDHPNENKNQIKFFNRVRVELSK
jgi:hypothetical protein